MSPVRFPNMLGPHIVGPSIPRPIVSMPSIPGPITRPIVSMPTIPRPVVPRPTVSKPSIPELMVVPVLEAQQRPETVNIPFITNRSLPSDDVQSRPSIGILVQTRPKGVTSIQAATYDPEDITVIPGRAIRQPSANTLVYQRNPATGELNRFLATAADPGYNPDPDYGITQKWLINARQGDHYDRVEEWNKNPLIADAEAQNMQGYTTLNEGMVWGPLPRIRPVISTGLEGYKRLQEYAQSQIEEENF